MTETIIESRGLTKEFIKNHFHVTALKDVDLSIEKGAFVALMGPSGSGKSTLLHLIAALDRPTSGDVKVLGMNPHELRERDVARWRNAHVGFVFQSFNLIPVLTALGNVELPLRLTSLSSAERREHAERALRIVGLDDRMHHLPSELSGGQQQRVAIARAFVTDPDLILADEPTGNLDAASADEILTLLAQLSKKFGKTVVMVTHDLHAAKYAGSVYHLEKGNLLPWNPAEVLQPATDQ
ncbi:MAG TPA: ABC transporter ATP-binding protein [Terracidiphilus sp.]|jgi:putative ABC transport system ATP-binding protein|nr:ABC transporter ATP-binding protein [Terracidiphilus sp.]